MPQEQSKAVQELLNRLMHEFFQTETSASRHCRREAERLGEGAGALAMRESAEHADWALRELPLLARKERLPDSASASVVGAAFSQIRDKVADKLLDRQRSYRGTILGMQHGVDVVRLLRALAARKGLESVANFCDTWLGTRVPLVQRTEDGLAWFAEHPELAIERARPLVGPGGTARGAA